MTGSFYDLYSSPNVLKAIKSRRLAHVACMGENRGAYRVWWGNQRERDHLKNLGIDGRILKWNFKKCKLGGGGMDWIDLAQDRDRWWALVNVVMNLQVP
jgi:hypothetical protein